MKSLMKIVGCVLAITLLGAGCTPVETDGKNAAERATEKRNGATKNDKSGSASKAKPTKAAPAMTAGQENALASAEQYLDYSSFSQEGLVDQLKFEDYSVADATFAANHVDADWNEQAAAKAEEYLDMTSYSHQGLVDQLKFEGFTPSQAEYGVKKAGL